MIDAARNFGEQISGIRIPKGCRLNDGLSCGLAQCGKRRRNCGHVFLFVGDAEWVNKLYQVCAFDPRAKGCDKVYQYALSDTDNPAAVAVRATYEGYARYLRNLSGL